MIRYVAFEIVTLGFGTLLVVNMIKILIRSREIGRSILEGYRSARPPVRNRWSGIHRFYEKAVEMNTDPSSMAFGAIMGLAVGLLLLALGVLGLVTAIGSCI